MDDNARNRVVEIAQHILSGRVGVIQGARALRDIRSTVTQDALDPDFLPFIVIDSETDTLPVGDVRKFWDAEALKRKDVEIEDAEQMYRETALDGCRKLLARYGDV
jgi:hypothetical protein